MAEKVSFEKAIEDEPMEMETEQDRLEKEQRIARMLARQKSFASKRLVREILDDVMDKVISHADVEMVKEMLDRVLEEVDEEIKLNKILKDLEQGPPGMEEKLESRLRTRRLEEMLAMRMLILEEEKVERLAEMTRRKESWITNWKRKNMENLVTKMISLDLEDYEMEWMKNLEEWEAMELDANVDDDKEIDTNIETENEDETEMYTDCSEIGTVGVQCEENPAEPSVSVSESNNIFKFEGTLGTFIK